LLLIATGTGTCFTDYEQTSVVTDVAILDKTKSGERERERPFEAHSHHPEVPEK